MPALSAVDRRLLESDLPPLRHALLSSESTLEYRDTGHGADAVLLLHGIGSSSAGYRAQLAGLSAQWRLLAWNAPGFGASTPLASPAPDVHAYAAVLANLLDALSLDHVHLVASSWGTLIAQAFAGRYPERTRAMVLSVPTRGYAHLPADERARRMAERLSPGARTQTPEERAPRFLGPAPDTLVVRRFGELQAAVHPAGLAQATHMLFDCDALALASAVHVPTLILAGGEDRVAPPGEHAERLRGALDGAALETFADCGHLLKLEAPDRFNRSVHDFLRHY